MSVFLKNLSFMSGVAQRFKNGLALHLNNNRRRCCEGNISAISSGDTTFFGKAGFLGVLGLGLLFQQGVAQTEVYNHVVTAGDYRLEETSKGTFSIIMSDAEYMNMYSPGDPALPQKIIDIALPAGADVSNVSVGIDQVDASSLAGIYNIVAQSPTYLNNSVPDWGTDKNIVDGKNMFVYGKDAFYPQSCIKLLSTYSSREIISPVTDSTTTKVYGIVQHVRVAFVPFQYNPVSGSLNVIRQATVLVNFTKNAPPVPSSKILRSNTLLMPLPPASVIDYVIITSNAIVNNSTRFADFVRMKKRQGRTVQVVTENEYGSLSGSFPDGRSEKIKQWLINNKSNLDMHAYVLLVGDPHPADPLNPGAVEGDVPMKMCYPRLFEPDGENRQCPTDMFYADLQGNWDMNNDGVYGVDLDLSRDISPDPQIAPTTFSARWSGSVLCDADGNYTFSPFFDDGARLWIDDKLIIDSWADHWPLDTSAVISLTRGLHTIKIDYFQNMGHSMMRLYWTPPGGDRKIIPSNHLYYWDKGYSIGGLMVTYFNNIDFTEPITSRVDPVIDHIWMAGDNDPVNGRKIISQLYVGRIPVYNSNYDDLDKILGKMIRYQSAATTDITWRKSVLLPMHPSNDATPGWDLGEALRTIASRIGFSWLRIYNEDYTVSGGPNPEVWPSVEDSVVKYWSQNPYGMVTWWTHGSSTSASSIFSSPSAALLNDNKPSFVFQASCSNGFPEDQNNLGYSLLRNGAIATISASRISWFAGGLRTNFETAFDIIHECNEYIGYAYTKRIVDSCMDAGEALSRTKSPIGNLSMQMMDFNLYGDPNSSLLKVFPNKPPVVSAGGPYSGNESTEIILNASGSYDPEGDGLEYRWDLDNNGDWDTPWQSRTTQSITNCKPYSGTVRVQCKDSLGLTGESVAYVNIVNVDPAVNAGKDLIVNEGSLVQFNGTFSDPGCEDLTPNWIFGDGIIESGMSSTTHSYGDNGEYPVTLTVTDGSGGVGQSTLIVKVNNCAPVATIDSMSQPTSRMIFAGDQLTFYARFTDAGWLDRHTSTWDFGDGTSTTGTLTERNVKPIATGSSVVKKIYSRSGTYKVVLTIKDDDGGVSRDSMMVVVFGNLHTTESLIIAERSKVFAPCITGGTYSELNIDAQITSSMLSIAGDAQLRPRAKIFGSVEVTGTCKRDNESVITGSVKQGVPVVVTAIPQKTVLFGSANITVNNDMQKTLTPGKYQDCLVRSRGTITLESGTYDMRSFSMEPDAKIIFNAVNGPIFINVNGNVLFGDRSIMTTNGSSKVYFYSNSSGTITIGQNITFKAGYLIAPNAYVNVLSRSTLTGPVCVRKLKLESDCTIETAK